MNYTFYYSFVAFTCYFGHIGNTANLGSSNRFLAFVYGAGVELFVVASIPIALNVIGRKWTVITMLSACCMFSTFFVAFTTTGEFLFSL